VVPFSGRCPQISRMKWLRRTNGKFQTWHGAAPDPARAATSTCQSKRPSPLWMSCRTSLRALLSFAIVGCGLNLGGEQFVAIAHAPPDASSNAPDVADADAGSQDARDGAVGGELAPAPRDGASPDAQPAALDAQAGMGQSEALVVQDGEATDGAAADGALADGTADGAAADGASADGTADGAVADGAADAMADGGTPCERVARCCSGFPLPLACSSGPSADGGESACESLLTSLRSAGLCP
jgi:hypothetical protein